jgi:NTP pyrophosphatase (non-canonical NTP hydrolase)
MKIKYKYSEVLSNQITIPIVVSRDDVYRMIGDKNKTAEENEILIDQYLKSKSATRVYDASFNEYQLDTRSTAIYSKDKAFSYLILGLTSEAGEIAGKYKKVIRDYVSHEDLEDMGTEWKKDFLSELGDVLWYVSRIADELGVSLSEIAERNISKLQDRKSRGVIKGSGDNR